MDEDRRVAIERFHEAFNRHDLVALAQAISEDVVFEDTGPPDGTRHVGRDAMLDECLAGVHRHPGRPFSRSRTRSSRATGPSFGGGIRESMGTYAVSV